MPYRYIGEHIDNTPLVSERRFPQNGHILHHAIMYNIFYDLVCVNKISLIIFHIMMKLFGSVNLYIWDAYSRCADFLILMHGFPFGGATISLTNEYQI